MKKQNFEDFYKKEEYLKFNSTLHEEDAEWKFKKIQPLLDKLNKKDVLTILDIGGGTGSVCLYCQNYIFKKHKKKVKK